MNAMKVRTTRLSAHTYNSYLLGTGDISSECEGGFVVCVVSYTKSPTDAGTLL